MRLLVTIAAAVCLGAHTLMGCCWGHSGGDESGEAAAIGELHVRDSHESSCCHRDSADNHRHAPHPCKCDCRGRCNFLPTTKVRCQTQDHFDFVAFLPASYTDFGLTTAATAHELVRSSPIAALPVRLHLWNQLLLV